VKNMFMLLLSLTALVSAGAAGQKEQAAETAPVRIGVMPDAGALPLFLMDGVELVPFMSARERDTAMQVGELDGTMTDLVSVVSFHQKGMPQRVLTITESRFMLVAHPDFNPESSPWSAGLSENTVIEFMVDQLAAGRPVEKVSIPQVPVRMEMLGSGKIPMACLTDAMAWPLLKQGFPIVEDQADTGLEPAVLVFTDEYVRNHPKEIAAFREQWNAAVDKINADPGSYSSLLLTQIRLPDDPDHPYPVPRFRSVMLPPEDTVARVLEWYKGKYGLDKPVSYKDLVIE